MVQMSKEFSISSGFEPIDIITLCTIWWPQVKSTDHQPKVSSIYFMRFLRSIQTNITTLLFLETSRFIGILTNWNVVTDNYRESTIHT